MALLRHLEHFVNLPASSSAAVTEEEQEEKDEEEDGDADEDEVDDGAGGSDGRESRHQHDRRCFARFARKDAVDVVRCTCQRRM